MTRLAAHAMGTRFEIALAGGDAASLLAAGEAALSEITDCDARLSLFRRDSLLSHINRTAADRPVRLDRDTFGLIASAMEAHDLTIGAFDITLAPLMRVWRFHGEASSASAPASAEDAVTGPELVDLDPDACTIRFRRAGVSLDLGGIAKGHALDRAGAVLREAGIGCALLHGGTSSVTAIGAPPDQEGWHIRLGSAPGSPVAVLRDLSLSVSSPRGRTVESGGERMGHILDPVTRGPVCGGAELAAAIDGSAVLAEGISTGLIVLNHRPPMVPDRVTTVLYDEEHGWRVEGENSNLVRPASGAALIALEQS